MNDRIKELAQQAGAQPTNLPPYVTLDWQNFAELIVHDCIRLAGPEDSYRDEWFNAKCDTVKKIKEYFGVE